jgi:hypothetical protein
VNDVFQFTAKGKTLAIFGLYPANIKRDSWRRVVLGIALSFPAARQMTREDIEQLAIDNGCPSEQI